MPPIYRCRGIKLKVQESHALAKGSLLYLQAALYPVSHHITVVLVTLSQNLDSSKFKDFVDDNSKFDENHEKFSKWVENTVGKGEIAHYEQFLLFPQCFQKIYTANFSFSHCVSKRLILQTQKRQGPV